MDERSIEAYHLSMFQGRHRGQQHRGLPVVAISGVSVTRRDTTLLVQEGGTSRHFII